MTNTLSTITSTTTRQPVLPISTESVTGPKLLEAAYAGTVTFSKVRGTGTLRHWPVLAPKSEARKQAEQVMALRAKKVAVEAIAKDLHKSVPTVRRIITAMAFTLELEGLTVKAKAEIAKAATANLSAAPKEPKAEKPAPKAAPKADKEPVNEDEASGAKPATGTPEPKVGKGGFKPTTASGKRAAATKARRAAVAASK